MSVTTHGCLPRFLLGGILGGVVGVAAGIRFVGWRIAGEDDYDPQPFVAELWLRADPATGLRLDEPPPRQTMARDLVDRVLRAGMTRAEVRALLGEPFPFPVIEDALWFGPEDEAWWLGNEPGVLGFEDEWLYLDFGAGDALERALIVPADASRTRRP